MVALSTSISAFTEAMTAARLTSTASRLPSIRPTPCPNHHDATQASA
jgi:hypothetical protein